MEIIAQEAPKGNSWLTRVSDGWLTVAVVVLASGASFGLGILAGKGMGDSAPIKIDGVPASAAAAAALAPADTAIAGSAARVTTTAKVASVAAVPPAKTSGTYVASKNGTKFYLPTCSTAKRIKEENKVWFDTEDEARAAGFTPGANCPGL